MNFDEYFSAGLSAEHARLRQRCISITENREAADDLVQTICLQAWEHRHTLRDREHLPQWLSALASNICKMWLRRERRQREHTCTPAHLIGAENSTTEEILISDFDLERDLERKELTLLLDHALAHLSPDLRALLTEHYIEEIPGAESAERRGIPLRTIQKRLERGKIVLRHLLQTQLHAELTPYLANIQVEHWETTRLWCPKCGQHHLQARFHAGRLIQFRCPGCETSNKVFITMDYIPAIKGYQRQLVTMMKRVETRYRSSLREESRPCPGCRSIVPLQRKELELVLSCPYCQAVNQNSLDFFALLLQEGRQFWQQQQKIHLIPAREVFFQNRPAFHVCYQSQANNASYEVFFARDTFEILSLAETKGSVPVCITPPIGNSPLLSPLTPSAG